MNKKEALTQLEIMATNATGRLGEIPDENSRQIERGMLKKHIEALDMAMDALKDYKPKTGEWVKITANDTFEEVKCSACGVVEYFNKGWKKYNYCPNCGAKMERGVDPNNCRKCELANECDLHICIKGVRKRMSERSKE